MLVPPPQKAQCLKPGTAGMQVIMLRQSRKVVQFYVGHGSNELGLCSGNTYISLQLSVFDIT